jgi:hypothetical protein
VELRGKNTFTEAKNKTTLIANDIKNITTLNARNYLSFERLVDGTSL